MSVRVEHKIERADGTIVRLIMLGARSVFHNDLEIDTFALVKRADSDEFVHYSGHPTDKSLYGLSLDDYIEFGRRGLMAVVRPHEVIKARLELLAQL